MISLDEKKELLKTILYEGNRKEFVYKGYECLINRTEPRWHLCGYIKYKPKNVEERNILYENFHVDISYDNYESGWLGEEWIGFDCMQLGDKTPHDVFFEEEWAAFWERAEYRTMDYVENCLINAIDDLEDYKDECKRKRVDLD